jgi:hypothetical protein
MIETWSDLPNGSAGDAVPVSLIDSLTERDRVDWRLLIWLGVWSLAMVMTIAGLLNGQPPESLTVQASAVLGMAMGGLAASWITTGTWVALIHLPDTERGHGQRLAPRMFVVVVWLIMAGCLAIVVRQSLTLLIHMLVMVAIGITGPLIVWHWTHRRIHHGDPFEAKRRSIRQLLGVTFTVALAIAALNLSYRWTGMTLAFAVLMVWSAVMWTWMTVTMLSRWWGAILLTIPLLIAEWFTVASLIDLRDRTAEALVRQHAGYMLGFYCVAILFLMMMRSSGHRWLASRNIPQIRFSQRTSSIE